MSVRGMSSGSPEYKTLFRLLRIATIDPGDKEVVSKVYLSTCCSLDESLELVGIGDWHLLKSFVHILNKLHGSLAALGEKNNEIQSFWKPAFMSRVFPISPPFTSWLVMVYNVPAPCEKYLSRLRTWENPPGRESQCCWTPRSLMHRWAASCWRLWGFSAENRNSHPQRLPFPL